MKKFFACFATGTIALLLGGYLGVVFTLSYLEQKVRVKASCYDRACLYVFEKNNPFNIK